MADEGSSNDQPLELAPGSLGPPPGGENNRWTRIWQGPRGLRAGWRLLIYVVLLLLIDAILSLGAVAISAAAGHPLVAHGGRRLVPGLGAIFFNDAGLFAAAVLAALLLGRFEGRGLGAFGLPWHGAFGKKFWWGALWGGLALSALLAAIAANGDFHLRGFRAAFTPSLGSGLVFACAFALVGFAEEFSFRGYPLTVLTEGMGFWPAAIVLSVAFGGVHAGNGGEALWGVLSAGLIGLFFCFTVRRTGTLWFAIGFHFLWDFAESFVYAVPDSGLVLRHAMVRSSFSGSHWLTGGSVGPEGSLLIFPLIAILFWLFHRAYPAARLEA
ncbi:MAG: lysostaphin resistance A-like protein [Terriglobales bacterium]